MELLFKWDEIKNRGRGLTFDDVLLIPRRSEVRSRRNPELSSRLTNNIEIKLPFISSNMDTITENEMALAMDKAGGFGILHRFMSPEGQVSQVEKLKDMGLKNIGVSIGVNADYQERTKQLVEAGANVITIDIAHGHSASMVETMGWVKKNFPKVDLIVGNVATPAATLDLIEAGANAIKVGIGPGSMCTTRIITGCGLPQLSAVALCAEVARSKGIPVIADGGIRTSGDIVKAIAAGAETVMLGSILAGSLETPGEIRHGKKQYRGMASKSAQTSWRGGVPEGMAAEGESTFVAIKGHVKDVINELAGGLRSGMSYLNATEITHLHEYAEFIELSPNGRSESHAHGLST